jgi:hypothetical protein
MFFNVVFFFEAQTIDFNSASLVLKHLRCTAFQRFFLRSLQIAGEFPEGTRRPATKWFEKKNRLRYVDQ